MSNSKMIMDDSPEPSGKGRGIKFVIVLVVVILSGVMLFYYTLGKEENQLTGNERVKDPITLTESDKSSIDQVVKTETIADNDQPSVNRNQPENEMASNTTSKNVDYYIVKPGDCLWMIAQRSEIYNSGLAWATLYENNKDIISDPNIILPGQHIKIK